MSVNAEVASLHQIADRARRSTRWLTMLPVAAAAVPFLGPYLFAPIGGYLAWKIARSMTRTKQTLEPAPMPPEHAYTFAGPGDRTDGYYIGHGLGLVDYKTGLEDLRLKIGRVMPKDRTQYDIDIVGKMQPVFVTDDDALRHMLITGPTGTGKTEAALCLIQQQINRNGGLFFFDAKADEKAVREIVAMAKAAAREHDLLFMSLSDISRGHSYNPFIGAGVKEIEELVSIAMKLRPSDKASGGNSEFYEGQMRNVLTAAIICIKAQEPEPAFNFKDLAVLLSDPKMFVDLYKTIPFHKEKERQFVSMYLAQWVAYDRDGNPVINYNKYREINAGALSLCLDFSHSSWELINDYSPDIELRDSILSKKIVIISAPALKNPQGLNVFARLFFADLSRAVGQIIASNERPQIPFLVFMDEHPQYFDKSQIPLFTMARAAGVTLISMAQSKTFYDSLGPEATGQLVSNTYTRIFFGARQDEDIKFIAGMAGSTINRFAQDTVSDSYSKSHKNYEPGMLRNESKGRSVSRGYREMREDLVQPEDLQMKRGASLMISPYGVFRMQMPILEFRTGLPQMSEVEVPRWQKGRRLGLNLSEKALLRNDAILRSL